MRRENYDILKFTADSDLEYVRAALGANDNARSTVVPRVRLASVNARVDYDARLVTSLESLQALGYWRETALAHLFPELRPRPSS